MATLYRKYRPRNFKEVVNQNHIKYTLEHQIQTGRTAHAYLFCGPRAVGKTTIARVFAKAINCENRKENESEPCGKCKACKSIGELNNLDVIEIDAASHTGVDNVRESVIASARVAPSSAKYKVFVIDEVHMLSISAFNALLKIMEEPPANVVFILCTTEVHKVPTTIISRCQRFDFKRLSVTDIVKKLQYIVKAEDIRVDKRVLESIARQSEGYMRDAESMLGQIVAIGGREITQEEADLVIPRSNLDEVLNLLEALVKKDAASGLRLVNTLLDEGYDLLQFSGDIIETMRKIMYTKINPTLGNRLGAELGENLELKANEISANLPVTSLVNMIEKFIEARNRLKSSFITQLPLELAIVELCENYSSNENQNRAPAASPLPSGSNTNTAKPKVVAGRPTEPEIDRSTVVVSASAVDIDIDGIAAKWNEVLAKIKSYNHSLSFILRACEPRGVDGNELCLAFKYKFHRDRVGELGIKRMIENTLKEVYGQQLMIDAIIDESLEVNTDAQAPAAEAVPAGANEEAPMPSEKAQSSTPAAKANGSNNEIIDSLLKNFGGKVIK